MTDTGSRRSRATLLWPLLAMLLPGCDSPFANDLGLILHDLDPPAVYATWWEDARKCTGKVAANLDRVRWFTVDPTQIVGGSEFRCRFDGTLCSAFWESPHTIVLAPAVVQNKAIVTHEMLHDQFQSTDHKQILSCYRTDLPF